MQRPLLIVVGPTASGKSSLAIHLAQTFQGEVVNADSVQLYRGFDIGSAKTAPADRGGTVHHLLDVLEPSLVFSAGDYGRMARSAVAEVAERGKLPVVVGGTGFYIRALLDGLPDLPGRDEELRARLARRKPGSIHRLLRRFDPEAAARIHPSDTQKAIRALEIRLLTRSAAPAPATAAPLAGFEVVQLGLDPPRDQLAQCIAQRTRRMFEEGLVEEVQSLLEAGLTGAEKPFESLGYKQVLRYLRGQISLEDARESTEIETRQYAKRQRTWFRRDARIHWLRGFGNDPEVQESAVKLWRTECAGHFSS